jgi:hypothetical protein
LDVCFDGLDVLKDSFVSSMEVCVLIKKYTKSDRKMQIFRTIRLDWFEVIDTLDSYSIYGRDRGSVKNFLYFFYNLFISCGIIETSS